jgi:ABC-type multidrug transport system ATPase subunit
MIGKKPILKFSARPESDKAPFGNEISFSLYPGDCLWLKGPSGRGKTTLAMYISGLLHPRILKKLHINVQYEWGEDLPVSERCGVLFQQTTLLDELTVAANLAVALDAVQHPIHERETRVKQLMDIVGLEYHRDGGKRPTELSGGMGRRASLALQLAQKKHIIVLDEPFTGLDYDVGVSIAKELVYLRKEHQVAFVLISHEPEIAKQVLSPDLNGNIVLELEEPKSIKHDEISKGHFRKRNIYSGISMFGRFQKCLVDYFFYSLPLIAVTFIASGLAISMLTCDTLQRLDVINPVLKIVDKEIRPLIKLLTGEEASPIHLIGVKMKVSGMLNATLPPAKASLYAIGMAKLFVLEIGPLLTALLLCGRIGGSYAGKVATMKATSQTHLLKTLGISEAGWTLYPTTFAAVISCPLLTAIGTLLSLYGAGKIGFFYGIVENSETFWSQVENVVFPGLRLKKSNIPFENFIEVITYPPIYHTVKAVSYILCILAVAEMSVRCRSIVTPRRIPSIITQSVVTSGLLVILMDWLFSQLWLMRI